MAKSRRPKLSASEQEVLDHLQVRLVTSPKDKARCDKLIVEHHYLKDATLVGEQLRYTARGLFYYLRVGEQLEIPS